MILGDLNFQLDIQHDVNTIKFNTTIYSFGLVQHVTEPTHKKGHTLDVLVTCEMDKIMASGVTVSDPGLCNTDGHIAGDHLAVTCSVHIQKPKAVTTYRKLNAIDVSTFENDILSSGLVEMDNDLNLDDMVSLYDETLKS